MSHDTNTIARNYTYATIIAAVLRKMRHTSPRLYEYSAWRPFVWVQRVTSVRRTSTNMPIHGINHILYECRLLKSCRGLFIQCLLSLVFYVNKTLFTKTLLTPTISAINQRLELKRVTRYFVPLFREIPNHSDEKNNNSPWEILMGSRFVRYVNCNDTK